MSESKRFVLYVKAASDGKSFGDCPFSHRAYMYATLKIPGQFQLVMIATTSDRPASFLQINPDGKVPVLVDKRKDNKVITDSAEITAYIDNEFLEPDLQQTYNGPGLTAVSSIFGKFAKFFLNKEESESQTLKAGVIQELKKVDDYLKSPDHSGKYLISDTFCEIDCMIIPRLHHVQVAGSMKEFKIPEEFTALKVYIANGEEHDVYKLTCPPDIEIIKGWSSHL